MSDIYSLSVVADAAFSAGCQYASRTSHSLPLSDKCQQALRLVRSCSNLISDFWYYPRLLRDGYPSVQAFEDTYGRTTISHLQNATRNHLNDIARICHMDDCDVLLLEDRRCPKKDKIELSKTMRETLVAIRTVDKPNVHRLREFAQTTLPLFGYIGRVGELVLEKTHQTLKRHIQLSNNRNIQIHAMSSAAFADWQGRLTMIARDATAGDRKAILCYFRLLAGREAVSALNAELSADISAQVAQALGPSGCLVRELHFQAQLVLSPRAESDTTDLFWTIPRPLEAETAGSLLPHHQNRALQFLMRAHGGDLSQFKICVGDSVSSNFSNGASGESFCRGDIVEVLVYHPTTPAFHFPFLVQPNCMSPVPSWTSTSGVSLWCVHCVLSLEANRGPAKFFAAVLPCSDISSEQLRNANDLRLSKYRVGLENNLSFARLEPSVRRAGILHDCVSNNCHPEPSKTSLCHSPTMEPLKGGEFFALTKRNGYPPRRG